MSGTENTTSYSFEKLKKFLWLNDWLIAFAYSLIFGLWVLEIKGFGIGQELSVIVLNFFISYSLLKLSNLLIRKFYNPNFYLSKNMGVKDAIEKNIINAVTKTQVYHKEDDYNKRLQFEISARSIWLACFLTIIILAVLWFILTISMQEGIQLQLDSRKTLAALLILSTYSKILMFIEAVEYEKARFKSKDVVKIYFNYLPLIIFLFLFSLWLIIDPNVFYKLVDILKFADSLL
jgi:hypothetical protein